MSKERSKKKNNGSRQYEVTGTLDVTRSGNGYVVVPGNQSDVLVYAHDLNTALNGDRVKVKVIKTNPSSGKKEGRITEVVQRKQTEFTGTIQVNGKVAFLLPDTDSPMPDIYIPLNKLNGAGNMDKAVVHLLQWSKDDKKPVGEVVSILDPEDQNDIAMKEILLENGFPISFPDDVIEESERLPDRISSEDIAARKDCRELLTFTIDPVDAKDFDDAISFQKINNQLYEIGVHIADVSHYVHPDTALDEEAYKRATSVYLPDRVNPMLPERISNELCSLRPNEDKLTFSVLFKITSKGIVKDHWIGKTVTHSNRRYSYDQVQEVIEGGEDEHEKVLLLLNRIAQNLRKERFSKGAINFSSVEVRFKLDEKGRPTGIVVKESKEAHQLIEEFMLLANRTVATAASEVKIKDKPIPFPYRIHDTPDEAKLLPFIEYAKKFGHHFNTSSPESIAASFNRMLESAKGKPEQHVLEQLGIRTMAKAQYTTKNIGHYGLGFENYCHFTSPIRRYPDVMVHRVLETILKGHPKVDKKLEEKCVHSSERERAAMESERAGNKYKQVEYMGNFLGEVFEGVVSGVAGFGFWVETIDQKCEGMVSTASLSEYDDFRLIEGEYSLVGRRSGRTFRMGDKVSIRVIAANLDKRQLDYEWVPFPEKEGEEKKKTRAKAQPAPKKKDGRNRRKEA